MAGKRPLFTSLECSVGHLGDHRNPLTHTWLPILVLALRPSLIASILIDITFTDTMITDAILPLSKKLSMVFVRCSRDTIDLKNHETLVCAAEIAQKRILEEVPTSSAKGAEVTAGI
jgi:hypothetical protein